MSSIDRKAHVLQRQKSVAIPRHFIFFDTETTQVVTPDGDIEQVFRLGWLCYWRRPHGRHLERIEWIPFTDIGKFWEVVIAHTEQKQRLWIIARNIVFDFTVCKGWQHLQEAGYKLKFFHNTGVSVIVTVKNGNKSIVFLDSMNWFPESLAKTGERIGIAKMDIDFQTCTEQQLSVYCRNDVLIEYKNIRLFIRFLQDNNVSRMCYTRASTALAAYLLRHYHTPIYIHNNAEAIGLERASYKGGRCECFYIGDLGRGTYYTVDVNSLYPYVMQKNLYPVKYSRITKATTVKRLSVFLKTKAVVARVQVTTDEPVYACKRDRTTFPIGTFETTLCTPELQYALEHNHIKRVLGMVVYDQANIFSSYVTTIYGLRQRFALANDEAYEQLCKYLLNSLYGKWGQKAENWSKIGDAPNEPDREELLFSADSNHVMRLRFLLGEVFALKGYSEAYNSFPAISSHVTAYGRMYLWKLMQVAGYSNFYYCDTDSLIVNTKGLDNLLGMIDDTKLGKLKIEERFTTLVIRGLKDYQTDTKTVIKGIRKNAIQLSPGVYQQEQWPSFKGLLNRGQPNKYTVKTVTKHLTREYTKGRVLDNGIVKPHVLTEVT